MKKEGGNYKDALDIIWGIPQMQGQGYRYQSNILSDLVNAQKVYRGFGIRMSYDPPDPPLLKGDIVFFKDTYQRDTTHDISEQGITHVGIVMAGPDADGYITFAHALPKQGVVPGSTLNIADHDADQSIIRLTPLPVKYADDLFAGFGSIRNIRPSDLVTQGNN